MDRTIFLITGFLFTIILAEFLYDWRKRKGLYSYRDIFQCFYLLAFYNVVMFIVKKSVIYLDPFFDVQVSQPLDMSSPINWIILTLVYDFTYYWTHRFEHGVDLFWKASHIHHHSSRYMNFLTGFRSSFFQPLYGALFLIPLYLMGFRTVEIFAMITFNKFFAFFSHTQHVGKFPFLDKFLATPSNHRVHHGRNPQYIDKNFGGIFIWWDKMFGTYVPEGEPVQFGVQVDPEPLSPKELLKMGFKS